MTSVPGRLHLREWEQKAAGNADAEFRGTPDKTRDAGDYNEGQLAREQGTRAGVRVRGSTQDCAAG